MMKHGENMGSNDVVLVISWPRSGNHWMRFLLGTYIHKKTDWDNISSIAPMIYHISNEETKKLPKPKIIGHHEPNRCFSGKATYIYLYRDPRDVIVSKYYYDKKMGNLNGCSLDLYVDKFVNGRVSAFGGWREHIKNWFPIADVTVSYEELLEDTEATLKCVLKVLDSEIDDNKIKETIDWCSFDHMSNLEDKQGWVWDYKAKENIKFMRKGKSKQWKEELTDNQSSKIKKHFFLTMQELDYVR